MMRTLLALALSTAAVGCVGGIDAPMGGGDDDPGSGSGSGSGSSSALAKGMFDDNVYPILTLKCSGGACHTENGTVSPIRFVAMDAANGHATATGFTAVVGNFTPGTAGVLTKITGGTPHYAITYDNAEVTKITDWLNQEVADRANGGGGSGSGSGSGGESINDATERVLAQFRGCMTIDDFETANMPQAWGNLAANNGQQCEGCHQAGADGFIASQNRDQFYGIEPAKVGFSLSKSLFLQYLTVDISGGAANAKVIINTASFTGVSAGVAPHASHPRFNPTTNNGMTALKAFYDLVQAKVTGGACTPAPFPNP